MSTIDLANENFDFDGKVNSYVRCDDGHINDTYFVNCDNAQYILQRVNTSIFTKPDELMANLVGVCDHIRKKVIEEKGDLDRNVRTIIKTKAGSNYFIDPDNGYWRAFLSIEDVVSYNQPDSTDIFYKAAKAFGHFFQQLSDYPAETLYETIPNFHNSLSRLSDFQKQIKEDKTGRASSVKKEIDFALERGYHCNYIVDRLKSGEFRLCVTHNDTKLNNILMDKNTGEGVCIIDLDTVMPGSTLFDFGDAIRFGASTAKEDETDLSKVEVDLDMFEAFTRGFLEELHTSMNRSEITSLPMGAYLMTYETAIRFLGDYINGDTYFRIDYPQQNLDRARNQFKIISEIENKMGDMDKIINNICKNL